MVSRMWVLALALCALVTCARADCEACIDGWCHSSKTLIQGFHVSDHLAIDQTNNILYVQINSNLNTAFYLDDLKIHLVQTLNTTGMAVDQDTNDLYTGYNSYVYKYRNQGSNTSEEISHIAQNDINLMFYKKYMYYTPKNQKGLHVIVNGGDSYYTYLVDYGITDFVVGKNDYIYFVANDTVYKYDKSIHAPKLLAKKNYVLSTDNNGDVYFSDASINVIYKLDESGKLVEFGAYKTGSVDRFVFDNANNIVFHDAIDGNIVSWKTMFDQKCSIFAPHAKYSIKEITPTNSVAEIQEEQD